MPHPFGLLFVALGAFTLYRVRRMVVDEEYRRSLVENHPKAWVWRKLFGVERTHVIARWVWVPLGLVNGVGIIAFGVYTTLYGLPA